MPPALRRVTPALVLALSSSCFSPGADINPTDPATTTGSGASEVASASEATGVTGSGPTSTSGEPTGEPGTATTASEPGTATGPSTTASDPSTGTTSAPPSCSNGVKDGDETDLDCGGLCAPCEAPLGCLENSDCVSKACLDQHCLADPGCLDASTCAAAACMVASCVDFACKEALASDGAPCDDAQVCTADEACMAGVCKASTAEAVALVDLPNDPSMGLYFDGDQMAGLVGSRVGDAGDFNGDGIADLYVVESKPNFRVYVLFGGPTLADTTLADAAQGTGGVLIDLDAGVTLLSVAAIGDVNNDEFADLIVGTPANAKTFGAGGAYVIRGRAETQTIKVAANPGGVGLLLGPANMINNGFGTAVAGLGDINGDGFDDFGVTAPALTVNGVKAGTVFVVYGMNNLHDGNIELDYVNLGKAFRLDGPAAGLNFGASLAGVGDFNNDGRRDVAIGQPSWSSGRGRVYVWYTPPTPESSQLATDPDPQLALAVAGAQPTVDYVGTTVASAGDFNGDGKADVIVGNGTNMRKILVVYGGLYGGATTVAALVVAKDASEITTLLPGFIGPAVGGGRDVNGDGVDDVVIGTPVAEMNEGEVLVAFGTKNVPVAPRKVADLIAGKGGFAIVGTSLASQAGTSVALIPSVNGDALADVLIGAPGYDPQPASNAGRAYVLYGSDCKP